MDVVNFDAFQWTSSFQAKPCLAQRLLSEGSKNLRKGWPVQAQTPVFTMLLSRRFYGGFLINMRKSNANYNANIWIGEWPAKVKNCGHQSIFWGIFVSFTNLTNFSWRRGARRVIEATYIYDGSYGSVTELLYSK